MHEHFYTKNNLNFNDKRPALKACPLKYIQDLTGVIFVLRFIKVCMFSCYLYEKNCFQILKHSSHQNIFIC